MLAVETCFCQAPRGQKYPLPAASAVLKLLAGMMPAGLCRRNSPFEGPVKIRLARYRRPLIP